MILNCCVLQKKGIQITYDPQSVGTQYGAISSLCLTERKKTLAVLQGKLTSLFHCMPIIVLT